MRRGEILDAAALVLARRGPHRLSVTDIAAQADVSRQTLYKYFPSREALLIAVGLHEKRRFISGVTAALEGRTATDRLDAALRYIVTFQREHPLHGLIGIEPGFVLEKVEQNLDPMRAALVPLLEEVPLNQRSPLSSASVADLIVRTALSYFLVPGDDAIFLEHLRRIAGLPVVDSRNR